jgi:hypothetical protein
VRLARFAAIGREIVAGGDAIARIASGREKLTGTVAANDLFVDGGTRFFLRSEKSPPEGPTGLVG